MMERLNGLIRATAVLSLVFMMLPAQAVTITPDCFTPCITDTGSVTAEITAVTPTEMIVDKAFGTSTPITYGGFVTDTGLFTVTETILNFDLGTLIPDPTPWLDFHIGLEFSGTPGTPDGLEIVSASASPLGGASGFTSAVITGGGTGIDFSGGSVAFNESFTVSFDIMVTEDFGPIRWDITQFPTFDGGTTTPMPEPTSLALLGLGLAGFGLARRRRTS